MQLERESWMRALMAHPPTQIKTLAARLSEGMDVLLTQLPQAGLGLLTLRDGAFDEAFYLGEFPLSVCRVELVVADGQRAAGGAQVMADDAELARALAILDALLAARIPGWEIVESLVDAGQALCRQTASRRNAMLAATRVDFAMLNNSEDEDEDA